MKYARCNVNRSEARSMILVQVGLMIGIVLARLDVMNKWNTEMVPRCENAEIITAIPTTTQLLFNSRSNSPIHFCSGRRAGKQITRVKWAVPTQKFIIAWA